MVAKKYPVWNETPCARGEGARAVSDGIEHIEESARVVKLDAYVAHQTSGHSVPARVSDCVGQGEA